MLYGGEDNSEIEGEDNEAVTLINGGSASFVNGFAPGVTQRTYASATMQSALAKSAYSNNTTGVDKKSTQKLRTINKSLAKLDQISQLNWSKKDLNLDALTINNQVFNRV